MTPKKNTHTTPFHLHLLRLSTALLPIHSTVPGSTVIIWCVYSVIFTGALKNEHNKPGDQNVNKFIPRVSLTFTPITVVLSHYTPPFNMPTTHQAQVKYLCHLYFTLKRCIRAEPTRFQSSETGSEFSQEPSSRHISPLNWNPADCNGPHEHPPPPSLNSRSTVFTL